MNSKQLLHLLTQHNQQVTTLRTRALYGNNALLDNFLQCIVDLLQNSQHHPMAYGEVMELTLPAIPSIIHKLNQEVWPLLGENHCNRSLDQYVWVWKKVFDGSAEKIDYPDVSSTLKKIKVQGGQSAEANKWESEILRNISLQQNQRVEFFSDWDYSNMEESMDSQQMSHLIYTHLQHIKQMKKGLTNKPTPSQIKTLQQFLALQPNHIYKELNEEYNTYRLWAKNYLDSHQDTLSSGVNFNTLSEFQLNNQVNLGQEERVEIQQMNSQYKKKRVLEGNNSTQMKRFSVGSQEGKQHRTEPNYASCYSPNQGGFILKEERKDNGSEEFQQPQGRRKIFSKKTNKGSSSQEQQIEIVKHTQNGFRNTFDNLSARSPSFKSPQTAFNSPSPRPQKTKLSDVTSEKQERRKGAPKKNISGAQEYVLKPYTKNFDDVQCFSRFRRNCLEDNFTLYASSDLVVSCVLTRMAGSVMKVQILYANQSKCKLSMAVLYRIPKCFKVEKQSKIKKKFILDDYLQHIFTLDLQEFPLQPCLLNLHYSCGQTQNEAPNRPTIISMPITLRNFVEAIVVSNEQWRKYEEKWRAMPNCFSQEKHVYLDKNVISEEEIENGLHEFVSLGSCPFYAISQYGCYCQHPSFHSTQFLIKISIRVDGLITLTLLARDLPSHPDQEDFLQLYLDNWVMLLTRVEERQLI